MMKLFSFVIRGARGRTSNTGCYGTINLSNCRKQSLLHCCTYVVRRSIRTSSDKTDVVTEYSEDQRAAIINTFNTYTEKELNTIPLFSGQLAKNIVNFREENGDFAQFADVLQVRRMGPALFEKACQSILTGRRKKIRTVSAGGSSDIVPNLTTNQYQNVQSVVSYRFRQNQYMWIHMNRHLEVLDWHMDDLFETETVKYEHHVYQSKMRSIIDHFPESTLYLSEEKTPLINHTRQLSSVLRDARTEAISTTLLNHQLDNTGIHKVFKLKSNVVGRYFKLMVAGERISGRDAVRSLLDNTSDLSKEMLIPAGFAQWYFSNTMNSRKQDQIASTLLTAIAFFKEVIKPQTQETDEVVPELKMFGDHELSDSSDEEL